MATRMVQTVDCGSGERVYRGWSDEELATIDTEKIAAEVAAAAERETRRSKLEELVAVGVSSSSSLEELRAVVEALAELLGVYAGDGPSTSSG